MSGAAAGPQLHPGGAPAARRGAMLLETVADGVRLCENGALFDALLPRLAAARRFIHFENYLWKRGSLSRQVVQVLSGRARSGCRVRVVVDQLGARGMGLGAIAALREAGCAVVLANPLPRLRRLGEREHRKVVVIDGIEAYVGGHCITDAWLGEGDDEAHHADLSLRLEGEAVRGLAACFADSWRRHTGEELPAEETGWQGQRAGSTPVRIACGAPGDPCSSVQQMYDTAVADARERLWIQNPYFVPKRGQLDALRDAALRGVDVRILMPSPAATDNPLVQYAARRSFDELLRCGVRIFEHPRVLLHQKALSVDGARAIVGSTNFDVRSFDRNLEVSVGLGDAGLADALDAFFQRYARESLEVQLQRWRARPVWHKLAEAAAGLLRRQL